MKKLLAVFLLLFSVIVFAEENTTQTAVTTNESITQEVKRTDIWSTQKMSISSFFDILGREFGVVFNFGATVDTRRLIDVNYRKISLEEALYVISRQYDLNIEKITDVMYYVSNYDGKAGNRDEYTQTKIYKLSGDIDKVDETINQFYKGIYTKVINRNTLAVSTNYNLMKQVDALIENIEKTQTVKATEFTEESYYKFSYISAEESVKILTQKGLVIKAAVDIKNNAIFITHNKKDKEDLDTCIKLIDKKDDPVLIEIMLLDKHFTKDSTIGFDFKDNFIVTKNFSDLKMGDFIPQNFDFNEQLTNTRILSQPKLLTTDKKQASIHMGERVPIITKVTVTEKDSGDTEKTPDIEYIPVGITMKATPTIRNEDEISLDMEIEISSISGYSTTDYGDFPIFNTKKMNSNILIKAGEIVYISGLISDDDRKKIVNVPILGDIPVVGRLFRKENNVPTQSEIIMALRLKPKYDTVTSNLKDKYEEKMPAADDTKTLRLKKKSKKDK